MGLRSEGQGVQFIRQLGDPLHAMGNQQTVPFGWLYLLAKLSDQTAIADERRLFRHDVVQDASGDDILIAGHRGQNLRHLLDYYNGPPMSRPVAKN